MKIVILFILFCSSTALIGQVVKHKTVTLHPYMSFQNYEHFKRLTLSSPDANVEYIAYFEYEWGYTYTLNVKETEFPPLSDGSRFEYELVDVISKTRVPDSTQFRLLLDANRYYHEVDASEQEMNNTLQQINDSTYVYFEQIELVIPNHLQTEFKTIVDGTLPKVGVFEFIDEKRIQLVKF